MARAFNLTAEINLRGPSNIRTVVADIRRQLGSVDVNINPRINPATIRNINTINTSLRALNGTLAITTTNAQSVSSALRDLGQSFNNVIGRNVQQNLNQGAEACRNIGENANRAGTQMQEFGRQSALAVRRFAAFSIVTGAIYAFTGAIRQGFSDFVAFDKEFVRLQQVTGESAKSLQSLATTITNLSVGLGVSSQELTTVAVTLAQAGLTASDTRKALEALALSSLAPSFDDMNQTVEGSIALMRQFDISATELEAALGSINSVAAKFAVEASDIITAIQRTGGVFATASRGVSQGTDALNEFIAVFTSVRATTRESAETIATGLRTIFTRIQRAETIQALERFGVTLTDLEGKFVGPFEAVRRLSEGLSRLDPRDLQFSQIVEELGGFRQIGKVIPLIQQFAVAQEALKTAQTGQASLAEDAATAQLSIANQISKVRQEFSALIRSIGESSSFRSFVTISLELASALIKLADAAKIVLPALTALAAVRGLSALTQFGAGFSQSFGAAGGARGLGQRLGGGRRFASGGLVPGTGNSDTVSAMLTPGEFVIRKKAVQAIGIDKLANMNRYANGGYASAPMVDDIVANAKGSLRPSKIALDQILRTGYGALDFDRTLQRTTGDAAYSKAKTPSAKSAVLSKYFRTPSERINDVKNARLTQFGTELQKAIRSGQVNPSNLSIISKSSRVPGLAEHINRLFGIPLANMIFTGGGSKEPALQAMRTKGPRASRVGRQYAQGGIVQKFGVGGIVENDNVGFAILKSRLQGENSIIPSEAIVSGGPLSHRDSIKQILETKRQNRPYNVIRQGLSKEVRKQFIDAIDKGLVKGLNSTLSYLVKNGALSGLPIPAITSTKSIRNFLSGINPGAKGSFFEEILTSAENKGVYTDNDPNRPFDFPNGLGNASKFFDKLSGIKYVDAKASTTKAKPYGAKGSMASKIASQLLFEEFNITKGSKSRTKTGILAKKVNETIRSSELPKGVSIQDLIDKGIIEQTFRGKYKVLKQNYATGGSVEDTVPALLTPGEFVINKKAASKLGSATLHKLNKADKIQGFNKGGSVGNIQSFADGGGVQRFFVGGAVVSALTRVLPSITRAFTSLAGNVRNVSGSFTQLGRNVSRVDMGFPRTGQGTARAGGSRADSRDFTNQGSAIPRRGMGDLGGFIALTAGGAAIEGAASGIGGSTGEGIRAIGGDVLNYGAIGATIGSVIPGFGTALGAATGATIGLVTGFFKAQSAIKEFAEKTRQQNIEKSGDLLSAALDNYAKNVEGSGAEVDKYFNDLVSQERASFTRENLLEKTPAEIASTQKYGAEGAVRILEMRMMKAGMTFEELSESLDPTVFQLLTKQIAETSPEYISKLQELAATTDPAEQERINGELVKIRERYAGMALAAKSQEIIEKRRAEAASKIVKEIETTLDIYRRANAYADEYSNNLNRLAKATEASVNDFTSAIKVQDIDRRIEEILGNLSAFSFEQVRTTANTAAGIAGGGAEAKALADTAIASKIIADQLPALVKGTPIEQRAGEEGIVAKLTNLFKAQGINIETPAISKVLTDIDTRLKSSASDTNVDKLTEELEKNVIDELSRTAGEGSKLLLKIAKLYNDTLQEAVKYQNQYNESILRANDLTRRSGLIRINAELDLAKALGNSLTLEQLNEPFDFEVKGLTKGLTETGFLDQDQAGDPRAILQAINKTSLDNKILEDTLKQNADKLTQLGPEDRAGREQVNTETLDLVQSIGKNKVAIDEGRKALEKIATDGTKAANALAKIEEQQRKVEGFGDYLQKIATSDYTQLFQMNRESSALAAARAGGPEFMGNMENRQLAFAGLEAQKELYSPKEFRNIRADLLTKFYESQGFEAEDFVDSLGMTLGEAMERLRGGVSEEDPNVKAYRDAINQQIAATDALKQLELQQANIFKGSIEELGRMLTDDLPKILQQAIVDANAAAATVGAAPVGRGAQNAPPAGPVPVPPAGAAPPAPPVGAAAVAPAALQLNAPPQVQQAVIRRDVNGQDLAIRLDQNAQAFIDNLNKTFTNFNDYVNKLENIANQIPRTIELTGNYTLDVQITGAAAFEALDNRMRELAVSLVEPKLEQLRNEVSTVTNGKVRSSAALGRKT